MVNILIGNTFRVSWRILTNNEATPLTGRDIRLILAAPSGKPMPITPIVSSSDSSSLTFVFQGADQKETGIYRLIVIENKGVESQALTSETMAFRLVSSPGSADSDIPAFGDAIIVDCGTGNLKIGYQGDSAFESWLRAIRPESGKDTEADFMEWLRKPSDEAAAVALEQAKYAQEQGDAAKKISETLSFGAVRHDISQDLKDSQKAQARKNINALSDTDGAVMTHNIANLSVTKDKLAARSVNTPRLVDDCVVTSKIADGAVTSPKIADKAVAKSKLAADVQEGLEDATSSKLLKPLLRQINLTGTNAERKAKLDQFETDWKALTGASDLTGARFVGIVSIGDSLISTLFCWCESDGRYTGVTNGALEDESLRVVKINATVGTITVTPLFSHLEAVTIDPDSGQSSIESLTDYVNNLIALGVNVDTDGCVIPITFTDSELYIPCVGYLQRVGASVYEGIVSAAGGGYIRSIHISSDGVVLKAIAYQDSVVSKADKTKVATSLDAIKIYDDEVDVADGFAQNLKNIAAYKKNLEALGVDTSKPYIIPIGIWFDSAGFFCDAGFLQGPMPLDGRYQGYINGRAIYIDATTGECSYEYLLTYEDIAPTFEAITIKAGNTTTDKSDNKTAIQAYVNNLKTLGVDTTKGYMIPIELDNGYQGFIMGKDANENHTGLIKRDKYNYSGGWILINTEGTYQYLECLTLETYNSLTTTTQSIVPAINEVNSASATNRADLDRTMSRVASPDDRALPLLCGQPPILFGVGTPKKTVVPDNWNQYDPETGEGYNWNGKPSAIGQQYVDTTAASGGRYIAARNGEWDLKWINC